MTDQANTARQFIDRTEIAGLPVATKHDGEIRIEQVTNGYVVSNTDFRSQRMSQTLAVFNHMSELAAWLATNFTIPTEPKR